MATVLDHTAQALLPVLFDATLKGAALLAVAGLLALALHRHAAAARHLVWALALVGCLVLPVLSAVLPAWQVTLPAAWSDRPTPLLIDGPLPLVGALGPVSPRPR